MRSTQRTWVAGLALVGLSLVQGCGSVDGTANPAPATQSDSVGPSSASSSPASSSAAPSSGATTPTLDLTSADPCTALPEATLADLKIKGGLSLPGSDGPGQADCTFSWTDDSGGPGITFDTTRTAERFRQSQSPSNTRTEGIIAGFPAVTVEAVDLRGCTVAVDAGPNSSVVTTAVSNGSLPAGETCQRATAIMNTLVTVLEKR